MLSISRICGLIIHTHNAYKEETSRRHIMILFIEIQRVSKAPHLLPTWKFCFCCCIKSIFFDFPPSQKTPKKKIIWRIRKSIKCQKAKCWTFFSSRISFHPPTLPIHVFFIYIFYGCLSHWKCMFFSKWRSCWFCLGCWKEDPYIYI